MIDGGRSDTGVNPGTGGTNGSHPGGTIADDTDSGGISLCRKCIAGGGAVTGGKLCAGLCVGETPGGGVGTCR